MEPVGSALPGDAFVSMPAAWIPSLLAADARLDLHHLVQSNRAIPAGHTVLNAAASAMILEQLLIAASMPVGWHDDDFVASDGTVAIRGNLASLDNRAWVLAAQLDLSIPFGNRDAWLGDGGWGLTARALVGLRSGRLFATFAPAFVARGFDSAPMVADQVDLPLGIGWHVIDERGLVTAEINARFSLPDGNGIIGDRVAATAMVGTRWYVGPLAIGLGIGHGLTDALGSGTWRFSFNLGWEEPLRLFDGDGDFVPDYADPCPQQPSGDGSGCPPADAAADTIGDAGDACPNAPGLVHRDATKTGCPPGKAEP